MREEFYDEILTDVPKYTLRDKNGNIINDDVDIVLKTPVLQEGTPLNRATFKNLQGDLYTTDRYTEANMEKVDAGTHNLFKSHFTETEIGATMLTVVYGNGIYVAVGNGGKILISEDKMNWTEPTKNYTRAMDLNQVVFGDGVIVAKGSHHIIYSNDNGLTWNESWYANSASILGLTYANGKFVGVGNDGSNNTNAYYSTDGITWSNSSGRIDVESYGSTIDYVNGKFRYISSSGEYAYSTNGLTWTTHGTTLSNYPSSVFYYDEANGVYWGIRGTGIVKSSDYITWTTHTSLPANIIRVSFANGEYIAGCSEGYIVALNDDFQIADKKQIGTTTIREVYYDESGYFVLGTSVFLYSQTQKNNVLVLDLPLTSYEKGKMINIKCGKLLTSNDVGEQYITSFDNVYININNLGAKKVNLEEIRAEQKYKMIYNGESFDIMSEFVSGHCSVAKGTGTRYVDLGAEYKYAIVTVPTAMGANYSNTLVLIKDLAPTGYLYNYSTSSNKQVTFEGNRFALTSPDSVAIGFSYIAFN